MLQALFGFGRGHVPRPRASLGLTGKARPLAFNSVYSRTCTSAQRSDVDVGVGLVAEVIALSTTAG